jgi:hypothetical protein
MRIIPEVVLFLEKKSGYVMHGATISNIFP